MTSIDVTVHQDYISASLTDWLSAIGDVDDALTASLEDWLKGRDTDDPREGGYGYSEWLPYTARVTKWAAFTFKADKGYLAFNPITDEWHSCSGLYCENGPWEMMTFNTGDHMLDAEIGAVWFYAPDGTLLFVEVCDSRGNYITPVVRRVNVSDECLADYSHSRGSCTAEHTWETEGGGITMRSIYDYDAGTFRIGEYIRPSDDGDSGSYYVSCPLCGTASNPVHFSMGLY